MRWTMKKNFCWKATRKKCLRKKCTSRRVWKKMQHVLWSSLSELVFFFFQSYTLNKWLSMNLPAVEILYPTNHIVTFHLNHATRFYMSEWNECAFFPVRIEQKKKQQPSSMKKLTLHSRIVPSRACTHKKRYHSAASQRKKMCLLA